ncbi:MAG: 5'-nucleotidase [Acidimicrobiia bacterium]|nr:MAG: 5'-nucleotidase [Acidimicrobiia bacterium]
MRLGIDLDGVVADFNGGWMSRYNDENDTDLSPDMLTTWDAIPGLTRFTSMAEFWVWARNNGGPGLFRNLPVFAGAKEALQRLYVNHEIVIITTKPPWANAGTFSWLGDNDIPTREVHILGEKWRVDCDMYLDDGPHNLKSLIIERPDRIVCRFVRPWNEPVPGVIDVENWQRFETLVAKQSR